VLGDVSVRVVVKVCVIRTVRLKICVVEKLKVVNEVSMTVEVVVVGMVSKAVNVVEYRTKLLLMASEVDVVVVVYVVVVPDVVSQFMGTNEDMDINLRRQVKENLVV
jgi:hypothetical protein